MSVRWWNRSSLAFILSGKNYLANIHKQKHLWDNLGTQVIGCKTQMQPKTRESLFKKAGWTLVANLSTVV